MSLFILFSNSFPLGKSNIGKFISFSTPLELKVNFLFISSKFLTIVASFDSNKVCPLL